MRTKMKSLVTISAFVAMSFVQGGLEDLFKLKTGKETECYEALIGERNPDKFRIFVSQNFAKINKLTNDLLLKQYLQEKEPERKRIFEWIIKDRKLPLPTTAGQTPQKQVAKPVPAAKPPSPAPKKAIPPSVTPAKVAAITPKEAALKELNNPKTASDRIALLLRSNAQSLTSKDLETIQKNNPQVLKLQAFQEIGEVILIRETAQDTKSPNPNPYLGKNDRELTNMAEEDPRLYDNPLFQTALAAAFGDVRIDIGDLPKTFPLNSVLKKTCNLEEFKNCLADLSPGFPPSDKYPIVELEAFLRANQLVAIQTPGFGNCAFDAVLLAWFCRENLYKDQWNAVLGTYLEAVIADFRQEIANMISDPDLKAIVAKKNIYVEDNVFQFIAQKLNTEIIVIAIHGPAQSFSAKGESAAVELKEIKNHSGALLIANNGHQHFVALRRM